MDEEPYKQVQNYILQRTLGQGTFGKVKLGYHTITDEYVAIKVLEKSRIENQSDLIRVQREITILRKVNHPNVIKLYEILESEQCLYLVMEYVKGGELYDYIIKKKYLPEQTAVRFFQQIVFATEYLHSQHITHRDLKPENLLLDEARSLKIADFGLSYLSSSQGELLRTACGSPCYAAPEMLVGRAYEGAKSDIWSCGIILFAMLCGYLPFEHENTKQLYELIKTSDFEKPEHLSKNAIDLLTKMLIKDPNRRINFDQIKQHPFFLLSTPIPRKNLNINDLIIIQKMVEMGYSQTQIIMQLSARKHNTLTTIYFLLQKKHNQPHRKSFFQNIQNIGNLKLELNQKKKQSSNQESPILERLKRKSIKSRLDNSPYLQTQISQKFKKINLSVQSKRVSIQLENIRQKTNSVQEKNYDYFESKVQSRKNSKNQGYLKPQQKREDIKTEVNEEIIQYFKGNPIKQRNKTQPNKYEDALQYFERNSKLNTSHQIVIKTPQHAPYMYLDNQKHLLTQLSKQTGFAKRKSEFKVQKLINH